MATHPVPQTPPPPSITLSTDLSYMVNATQQALMHMPGAPHIFQRARQLCLIAHGITPPKWLQRAPDAPVIVPLDREYLIEMANQAADWQKYTKRTNTFEAVFPPTQVLKTLLARPFQPFPLLEGVIQCPTLRPDGSLLNTPGYDVDTGLYLDTNGTTYPAIPTKPTLDQARSAIGTLQQVFIDFPFTATHHFSAVLAAVLTLVARYTFQGNVPLFAATATTRGSGKGLLVDTIATIATGRTAPHWPQTMDEEEERKRILTLALDGDPLVLIDNVTRPLGSAPLDAALTAQTFKDRILGKTQSREAPMNAVFFASGNNLAYQGDMARRVLPIELDPKMEKPEERTGFTHPRLLAWTQEQRPALVVAALTILKAYFTAGCPTNNITPLGSFEAWSDLIRSALVWAGEQDPCEGRKDIEAQSDPQYEAFHDLLQCWDTCYKTEKHGVSVKRAVQEAVNWGATKDPKQQPFLPNDYDHLRDALGFFDPKYDGRSLRTDKVGYTLRAWKGRVIEQMWFANTQDSHTKVQLWRVETP
jgi:hypothetical protein